jgi:hypothetical protein
MRLDPNPSFRKIIAPWYDSDALCYAVIALMLVVFFFGLAGISVARSQPSFSGHIWVPLLLSALSLWVIVTTFLRLVRRRRRPS